VPSASDRIRSRSFSRDHTVPASSPLQTALLSIAAHSHAHAHSHVLDLNAAWFVSLSHITRKGAKTTYVKKGGFKMQVFAYLVQETG
jgi:hypothetical protein